MSSCYIACHATIQMNLQRFSWTFLLGFPPVSPYSSPHVQQSSHVQQSQGDPGKGAVLPLNSHQTRCSSPLLFLTLSTLLMFVAIYYLSDKTVHSLRAISMIWSHVYFSQPLVLTSCPINSCLATHK